MKLVPLGDRVVIKALKAEETTKSGIVLPGQSKEKPQQAEVVAVGPGGTVDGKEVQLTLKEFDLLCYLILNKGIVLSRDQIMQAVWDSPFEMESRTIDMHIMSLRQKLGSEGSAIRTVRGVGYRLGDRKL